MKYYILLIVVVLGIIVAGCTTPTGIEKDPAMMEKKDVMVKDNPGDVMIKDDAVAEDTSDSMMEKSGYTGKILAGTEQTPYREFNQADYELALKENKDIMLYFYASWCPLCVSEQQETFAAFNELNEPNLVGFRVNYRDSDTDDNEEALAKEFGIPYQHTKVILKDGKMILKAPDSWNKQRYLDELAKI